LDKTLIKINSLHDLHDETILEELISIGETSTLIFQKELIGPASAAKLMSSFANTDGGIIIFGIDDNGIVLGINNPRYFNDFAMSTVLKIEPPISGHSSGVVLLREKPLGCIMIWPQRGLPVSVDGQFFKRVGQQTVGFGPEEFKTVVQERDIPASLFLSRSDLQNFLELADEDTFIEILLVPVMRKLGFTCVLQKGHSDKSLEFGQDLRCFKIQLPTGHWLYFAAQVKAGPISYSAKEPTKNIEQILIQVRMAQNKNMFDYETNTHHKPDHIFLIASGNIVEGARAYLCEQLSGTQSHRILFLDSNLILEKAEKAGLPFGVQQEIGKFLSEKQNTYKSQPAKEPAAIRLGEFISKWVLIEKILYQIAELTYPDHEKGQRINISQIPSFLARDKTLTRANVSEIERLRKFRNQIIHGEISYESDLTDGLMNNLQDTLSVLEILLSDILDSKEKCDP
jgi:hypothetical protein